MDSSSPRTRKTYHTLLSLSDELLLNILQNLDRHADVPSARLVCRRFNDLSEAYFFRNVMLTLPEQIIEDTWQLKLCLMPPQIQKSKHFTILNQRRVPRGYFYTNTISRPDSYRILRWSTLESNATKANKEFAKASCFNGVQFYYKMGKFHKKQLTAFRWRHAIPLSLSNLKNILQRQGATLQEIELSMIQPPSHDSVQRFRRSLKSDKFPVLRALKYHGISHTEPLLMNRPEKGGRFRMLRPLFQRCHETLQELVLSQDHCISQVGKTPMTLGRTIHDTLCHLDDLYIDTSDQNDFELGQQDITLNLTKLELGGFHVNNIFDIPTVPTAGPRVHIHLPGVKRLVLNNCFDLENLLSALTIRRDEVQQLTEFAVRIEEDDQYPMGLGDVLGALRSFLLSFQGLEVLSVLIDGSPAGIRLGKEVLEYHAKSLRAYSVAARNHAEDYDADNDLRFVSLVNTAFPTFVNINPGCLSSPPPLREYGTFLDKIIGDEYARLRYLSQFRDLRTVVIRNFPPLKSEMTGLPAGKRHFWRDARGYVSESALYMAETFAEQIAVPFFALPTTYTQNEDQKHAESNSDIIQDLTPDWNAQVTAELEQVAAIHHTPTRDKILTFSPSRHSKSPTPKTDPTYSICKERAQVDPQFREVMQKVESNMASASEQEAYDGYREAVRIALGLEAAPEDQAPKLKLLVIGDWSYRDQMNISGPRRWDPEAWSVKSKPESDDNPYEDDDNEDADNDETGDSDDDSDVGVGDTRSWNWRTYTLRPGFRKEFDASLLPIFFKITWQNRLDQGKGRWRWRAHAEPLNHTTLEGLEPFPDTRLLDFAWAN